MAAHQAAPSLGFSRQEYWSGVPLPSPEKKANSSQTSKYEVRLFLTIFGEPSYTEQFLTSFMYLSFYYWVMSSLYILDTSLSDIWFAVISSHSVACLSSEKATAPHSSTLAWKIPWMEEPCGLQSWDHEDSDTTEQLHFHFSLSFIGEGNGNPLQCSCLENPRDGGAWWAAIYGVAQSRTRLKRLSSSSSFSILHQ